MRKRLGSLLWVALWPVIVSTQSDQPTEAGPPKLVAITGAALIDGTGQTPLKDVVILIEGERIKAVGKRSQVKIPEGAQVIGARGKFIIPGLIDSHVHLAAMRRHERADLLLPIYLRSGVTTVRDLGSPLELILLLRAAERSGTLVSPRISTSGPILDGSSGEWPTDGFVTTASEAEEVVERLAAAHVDLIKIYDGLSPETARAIIRAAHENGLSVTGHIPVDMTVEEAVEAGLDGIEHIELLVRRAEAQLIDHSQLEKLRRQHQGPAVELRSNLDQLLALDVQSESAKRLMVRLATRQVILDPVLVACEAVWAARLGAVPKRSGWLTEAAWELQRHAWDEMAREFAGLNASERAELRRNVATALKRMKALVGACHRAGVLIIAGTDGPGWAEPGSGLHRELELLTEAGLSPMAALLAATRQAAKALGKEKELGTIEAGKLADLVILDANPLEDIRHMRQIHRVMKGGVLYDPASLPRQGKPAKR
jgi:imidazolonepropionase-like amidohydrolase